MHIILDLVVLVRCQAILSELTHSAYPLAVPKEDERRNAKRRRDRG